jgi:EmrB/QacA subfamily drug resistance transporter
MQPRWKVLTVVSVAVFMASLDLFIVNVAFPDIRADFAGTSVSGASWVLNAYAIVFAALLVPAGRYADRVGRKRGFIAGLVVFLIGSLLSGLAPSIETLVAARVLQAAGAALLMPTSLALLLPEFPPAERPVAIGAWAAVGGVAAAAGPPIGGLLVEVSWRLVFLVNIPIGLGAIWFAVRLLHESKEPVPGPRPDLVGTLLLVAAIGALSLGLVQSDSWGWGDARTLAALAGAAAGLALFVRRSATHPSPVVDLEMLRVRSFAAANTSAVLFFSAFGAMLLSTILFMTGVWGDSILAAGLSISPGPIMAATFASQAGKLTPLFGQRKLAAVGNLLFALGAAYWLVSLGATPDYAGGMLPGLLLTGIGVGLTIPSLSSAAASSLPPARFATGTAVLTMSRQIGSVLGIALLVAIVGNEALGAADFEGGWILMIVASSLGSLAAWAIGPIVIPAPQPAVAT